MAHKPEIKDIFISYSHENLELAKLLADVLQRQGWSVWWDDHLRSGQEFDREIEKAIVFVGCVVVLWSQASINSNYVKKEASLALIHDKLVPVRIEEVDLPDQFKQYHAEQLIVRNGFDTKPEFKKFMDAVAKKIGLPSAEIIKAIAVAVDKKPEELKSIDYPRVASLDLKERPIRDISQLERLTGLEYLVLKDTQVSDLRPLKDLTCLQRLGLRNTRVCNLEPISGLTNLYELNLVNTPVKDLTPLKNLPSLKLLHLRESAVSDLKPLSGLSSLRALYVGKTEVSDLEPLRNLTGLQRLGLKETKVTNLETLRNLTGLQEIILNGTEVSDLTPLYYLTDLKNIDLGNTSNITPEKINNLQNALPQLEIIE